MSSTLVPNYKIIQLHGQQQTVKYHFAANNLLIVITSDHDPNQIIHIKCPLEVQTTTAHFLIFRMEPVRGPIRHGGGKLARKLDTRMPQLTQLC